MAENGTPPNGMVTMTEALQVYSHLAQRLALRHGVTFGGERNLYETLGYQQHLEYKDYLARYQRGGIAAALINAFTEDTWRLPPIVREMNKEDETTETTFEKTWDELVKRLKLWRILERADRLASIGRYAVVVLGLRGQTDWSLPASPVRSPDDLVSVQTFSEEHATIRELVGSRTGEDSSPLFGTPKLYDIDFSKHQADAAIMGRPMISGEYSQPVIVHASRVIHVAFDGLEDDIIGTPSLQNVWNYLDDLDKLVGGTAEMTWKDSKQRFVAALREGAVLSEEDAARLDEMVKLFGHNLLDVLQVQNIDVTQFKGNVPDASNNVDMVMGLIAGTKRIPKRRLLGSERGELASDQDEGNLAATIGSRQTRHAEPIILRPFNDRLIALKVLPAPRNGYEIEWRPLLVETELEKAQTAKVWAETIAIFAGKFESPKEVLPLVIFLSDILGWDKEQVDRIMDELAKQAPLVPRLPPVPVPVQDVEENALTDSE